MFARMLFVHVRSTDLALQYKHAWPQVCKEQLQPGRISCPVSPWLHNDRNATCVTGMIVWLPGTHVLQPALAGAQAADQSCLDFAAQAPLVHNQHALPRRPASVVTGWSFPKTCTPTRTRAVLSLHVLPAEPAMGGPAASQAKPERCSRPAQPAGCPHARAHQAAGAWPLPAAYGCMHASRLVCGRCRVSS